MNSKVQVTGLDKMLKALSVGSMEQHSRELKAKIEEIAQFLLQRIRANAPIDTGELREALDVGDIEFLRGKMGFDIGVSVAKNDIQLRAIRLHEEPFKLGPTSLQQAQ